MFKEILGKLKLLFFPCKENNFKARLLRRDFLFHLVLAFLILRVLILPFYLHFPESIFFAKIVSSDILKLLNHERRSQGLNVLREDPRLKKAALMKAKDMLENDYFGHESPTGVPGWYFVKKAGYPYEVAGENLAIGFLDSKEVHQAWNNSPSHRYNLLHPKFEDVGIAVLRGEFQGNEVTVVVQFFGKQKEKISLKEEVIPPAQAKSLEEEKLVKDALPSETVPSKETATETSKEISLTIPPTETPTKEIQPQRIQSLQFNFWHFLITKYNQVAQKVIFMTAFLIFSVLIFNMVLIFKSSLLTRAKLLILKEFVPASLLAVICLVLLGLFDKLIIIQLIPHQLTI